MSMDTKHDARKLDAVGKQDLRRRVVHAVNNREMSKSEAARVFGVSRTSVHAWLDLYDEEGEEGLVPARPGRPKGGGYLKGWQAGVIVNIIKDRSPDQLKLPFALWTREAVRDLIYEKYGIWYALRSVGDLLDRWGFTAQKPQRRAAERDDEAIRSWLEEDYPKLRQRAKRENAEIYWEDETGLRSDHFVGRSYAPRGETPDRGDDRPAVRVQHHLGGEQQGDAAVQRVRGRIQPGRDDRLPRPPGSRRRAEGDRDRRWAPGPQRGEA